VGGSVCVRHLEPWNRPRITLIVLPATCVAVWRRHLRSRRVWASVFRRWPRRPRWTPIDRRTRPQHFGFRRTGRG